MSVSLIRNSLHTTLFCPLSLRKVPHLNQNLSLKVSRLFHRTVQNYKLVFLSPPPHFNPKFQVSAIFCEYEKKFLFLLRQPDKPCGNTWGIPGGKVDSGETPRQAALREFFEETQLTLKENDIVDLPSVAIRYPTHDFIYHMFRTKLTSQPYEVNLNLLEHKEARWLTLSQALRLPLIPGEDECIHLAYGKELLT